MAPPSRVGHGRPSQRGIGEVVNRPAMEVTIHRPEEPDVNSTSPVLWELGAGNRPWLPDDLGGVCSRLHQCISPSFHSPSYLSPFLDVQVPWPCFLLSFHCPTCLLPSAYVYVPWPCFLSSFHSPAYLSPLA